MIRTDVQSYSLERLVKPELALSGGIVDSAASLNVIEAGDANRNEDSHRSMGEILDQLGICIQEKEPGIYEYQFTIGNGEEGLVRIVPGELLTNTDIETIKEARGAYGAWALPKDIEPIKQITEKDGIEGSDWGAYHIMTRFDGRLTAITATYFRGEHLADERLPLEFGIWEAIDQEGQRHPLWDLYKERHAERNGISNPENAFLILHRLGTRDLDREARDPRVKVDATAISFSAGQLALMHQIELDNLPISTIHSQQQPFLQNKSLKLEHDRSSYRAPFTPTAEALNLAGQGIQIRIDRTKEEAHELFSTYPGYWFNQDVLKQQLLSLASAGLITERELLITRQSLPNGSWKDDTEGLITQLMTRPSTIKYLSPLLQNNPTVRERVLSTVPEQPFNSMPAIELWRKEHAALFNAGHEKYLII